MARRGKGEPREGNPLERRWVMGTVPAMPADVFAKVGETGVVAVLMIEREEDAVPLARALLAGGVNVMELTLRTEAAMPALKRILADVPEMIAGVGTILTSAQAVEVAKAGAAFGVAPGFNPRVASAALEEGLPFAPGIATPTDIELALDLHDFRVLKFFPAEHLGGLKYLEAIAAPYAHRGVRYMPLGGISAANMGAYVKHKLVSAIGGSWIAPKDLLQARAWPAVTKLAAEAAGAVKAARAMDLLDRTTSER